METPANGKVSRVSPALWWGVLAALAACVLWTYWPALTTMAHKWNIDAQYSHGFLVPAFSAALLWLRRDLYQRRQRVAWFGGLSLLGAGLGLYLYGSYIYVQWFEAISLVPCVAGVCLLIGGWPMLRWAWPSVAFLAFMVPLPYRVEMAFCDRLQAAGAAASTFCLQTMGFPAFREGTDILLNDERIQVQKACSGLGMLVTFFALSVATALLINRPLWQKLLVVASAVPIALASNITRITATAALYQATHNVWVRQKAHDSAGWMMMIVGLILLALGLKYLSYLAPEAQHETAAILPKPAPPRPAQSGSSRKARDSRHRRALGKA